MAFFQATVIIAFVVCAAHVIVSNAATGPDVTFEELACNGRGIDLASDYARAKDISLEDAVEKTPIKFYDYYGKGVYNFGRAYSHGKCLGTLSKDDCNRCMQVAHRQMIMSCSQNTEGWVQLKDCFIGCWEFPMY